MRDFGHTPELPMRTPASESVRPLTEASLMTIVERGDSILAENLAFLMVATGQSARGLSIAAGLDPDTVRNILRGKSKQPRHEVIARLSEALGVEPERLVSEWPEVGPQNSWSDLRALTGEELETAKQSFLTKLQLKIFFAFTLTQPVKSGGAKDIGDRFTKFLDDFLPQAAAPLIEDKIPQTDIPFRVRRIEKGQEVQGAVYWDVMLRSYPRAASQQPPHDAPDTLPILWTSPADDAAMAGAFIIAPTPGEFAPRPPQLSSVPGSYGLFVPFGNLEPRYRPGELVYLHPTRPLIDDRFVLVQLKSGVSAIKLLKRRARDHLLLANLSPASDERIPLDDVDFVNRIILAGDAK